MRRLVQSAMAFLLVLTSLAFTPLAQPETALAYEATVMTCDEASFDAALAAVEGSGGGVITFDCSGTIVFSAEQVITTDVVIVGNGQVTMDGNNSTRLFSVDDSARLTLDGLSLRNGLGAPFGGAIANIGALEVIASTFSNNRGNPGGAIYNGGTAEITASKFSNNSASLGGAIENVGTLAITASTFTGNSTSSGGRGGAINSTNVVGSTTITQSTFSANSANTGGAIYNRDGGTMVVAASTFMGNSVVNAGGAIYNSSSGAVEVTASTFAGNDARIAGAAIYDEGSLNVQGTILANSLSGGNCGGILTSLGFNLSDDGSCALNAATDIPNSASVNLGPLVDNGGPTETMLPEAGSDAAEAIPAADCLTASTSSGQRGVARPQGDCEIGAVELADVVPVQIIAAYSYGGDEGSPVAVSVVVSGPAGASFDSAFDCDNDGAFETAGAGNAAPGAGTGTSVSGVCTFSDDGVYTVGVQVSDAGDGSNRATSSVIVNVENATPIIISVSNDGPVDEAGSAMIMVTADDAAGINDPLQYEFDCDNDGTYEIGPQAGNTTDCTFGDAGNYAVPVRVTDDADAAATGSTIVTVSNFTPAIGGVANDSPVGEGSPATVTVNATHPAGAAASLHYSFDCDDDGAYEIGPQASSSAICTFGDDGSFTVNVLVADDSGDTAEGSTVVVVENVDPSIGTLEVSPLQVAAGEAVNLSATFTDPGVLDTHKAFVSWGDGLPAEELPVDQEAGSGSALGSHVYAEPGTYIVTFGVIDDELGVAGQIVDEFVVVFIPAGGHVTGGGWIDSPSGAYLGDLSLTGKANFGFVSKYKKGASVPTGNVQFKVGELNFHADSYDWLIVDQDQSNARFKGSGTINGELAPNGDLYKFMAWVGDGPTDTFRMRIWYEDGGSEVEIYDNGVDQPISGGQIKIHS
ncbi:MAG: PKD domain-containing protein [Thermomicrobiales bacterium]